MSNEQKEEYDRWVEIQSKMDKLGEELVLSNIENHYSLTDEQKANNWRNYLNESINKLISTWGKNK